MRVSTSHVNDHECIVEVELDTFGPVSGGIKAEAAKLKEQANVLAVVITTPGSMVVI